MRQDVFATSKATDQCRGHKMISLEARGEMISQDDGHFSLTLHTCENGINLYEIM